MSDYLEAAFLGLPEDVLTHGWEATGAQAEALEAIERDAPNPGAALRLMVTHLGNEGVLRLVTDAALGGRFEQTSFRAIALGRERLGRVSPLADLALTMQGLGSFPITIAARKYGQPNAAELLAPIVHGEKVAAFALTEPEAGTDLSRIESSARRDGDGYVLDGEKVYISNAPIADRFTTFARTGDDGRLSAFVVDRTDAGVEAEPMEVLGGHPIGRLRLKGVRVPEERRLGPEGKGMALALGTLGSFRPTVGAAAVGFAQRALDEAIAHTKSREQFGGPLAKLPQVQARVGRMACAIDGARLLVQRAVAAIDAGEDREAVAFKGSMAKYVATEAAQEVVDSAVQLHGGLGVEERSVVARLYQDVRSLRIYEGTNDVHEILIARELLR
ncbi:MAG: acyl-CoA dehydrogenase [Deltaproteobacteria bacterium]|nr:acyl-CoA dehydrogenase [Deltaproteobacteria bacterium]